MKRVLQEKNHPNSANSRRRVAQGKFPQNAAQDGIAARIDNSPLMLAQRKKLQTLFGGAAQLQEESAPKPNNTGLPDNLKSGIENLSGMSMDHVKVHYNSSRPAQLNALAYAQGHDIHIAPGQEKHLPHEAWHVVQQAQGRVQPTMQMKGGVQVNDDQGLEREADVMGGRILQAKRLGQLTRPALGNRTLVIQRKVESGLKRHVRVKDRDGRRAWISSEDRGGYWVVFEDSNRERFYCYGELYPDEGIAPRRRDRSSSRDKYSEHRGRGYNEEKNTERKVPKRKRENNNWESDNGNNVPKKPRLNDKETKAPTLDKGCRDDDVPIIKAKNRWEDDTPENTKENTKKIEVVPLYYVPDEYENEYEKNNLGGSSPWFGYDTSVYPDSEGLFTNTSLSEEDKQTLLGGAKDDIRLQEQLENKRRNEQAQVSLAPMGGFTFEDSFRRHMESYVSQRGFPRGAESYDDLKKDLVETAKNKVDEGGNLGGKGYGGRAEVRGKFGKWYLIIINWKVEHADLGNVY